MATKRVPLHIVQLTINFETGHYGFATHAFHANAYTTRQRRVNSRWAQHARYKYYEDKRLVADAFAQYLKRSFNMSQTERRTVQDGELLDYMTTPTIHTDREGLTATLLVPDGELDKDALYMTLRDALHDSLTRRIHQQKRIVRDAEKALEATIIDVADKRRALDNQQPPALVHALTERLHVELTDALADQNWRNLSGLKLVFYTPNDSTRVKYDDMPTVLEYTTAARNGTNPPTGAPSDDIRRILDLFHVPYTV